MTANAAQTRTEVAPVLAELRDVRVHFPTGGGVLGRRRGVIRAVDGVSMALHRGETLGLVGESGSGKSTTGRAMVRLRRPTSGSVTFDGIELTTLGEGRMRSMRRRMQMIFQDPLATLNPRMTIGDAIEEPLRVHNITGRRSSAARSARVRELLSLVGLNSRSTERYPHEFSGGQLQRVGIARALAVEPDLLVADEPVSALDVSIQAQIVNLLEDLQTEFRLTYLFIAHDLAVVRHTADRVAVMYLGRLVEVAPRDELYEHARHPYTIALLSAVPIPDPDIESRRSRIILTGDVPSPADPPSGCHFHTRCWLYEKMGRPERCRQEDPQLRAVGRQHEAACHFAEGVTEVGGQTASAPVG
jgi:oligopeptide/dipeptide ABC transporter ATP-binding protein